MKNRQGNKVQNESKNKEQNDPIESVQNGLQNEDKNGLIKKAKKAKKEKVNLCKKCGKVFSSRQYLKYHDEVIHNNGKKREKKLEETKVAKEKENEKENKKVESRGAGRQAGPIEHLCPKCGKVLLSDVGLKYHLSNHDKSEIAAKGPAKCEMCVFVAKNYTDLLRHIKTIHPETTENPITCEICGKVFSQLSALNNHKKKRHVTEEELAKISCKCQKCDVNFSKAYDLNEHLKDCLSEEEKKNLKCLYCESENWLSAIAIIRHAAEDHQSQLQVCHICDKVLKSSLQKTHMWVHGKEKKTEKCPQCTLTFNTIEQVKNHALKVHGGKGVAYHVCQYCDAKYAKKHRLNEHINAKHIKKSFKCPQCDFTSFRKRNLNHHIQVVHVKKIVAVCPYGCGKEFTEKARVYPNHLKKCDLRPDIN